MKRPSTGRSQLRQAYSLTPFRETAARGDSREMQDRLRYVAIADTEQAYAMRLMTFLDSSGRIPFDTRVFTEPAGAVRAMQEEEILILVASQSFYSLMLSREMGGTYSLPGEERMPGAERPAPPPVLILAEEGGTCGEGITAVSKYQAMEGIELEILKLLMTLEYIPPSPVRQGAGMELIGNHFFLPQTPKPANPHRTADYTFRPSLCKWTKLLCLDQMNWTIEMFFQKGGVPNYGPN